MAIADYPREVTPAADDASSALLRRNLDRLAKRRNQARMVRALVLGAIPGMVLASVSILLYRLFLIDGPAWAPLAMIGAGLLVGWRLGAGWRAGTFVAAWDADCALGAQDRMASALSFVAPEGVRHSAVPSTNWKKRALTLVRPPQAGVRLYPVPPTNLVPALVTEAAEYSNQLDPRRVYPIAFGKPERLLLVLSILCLGVTLMPDQPVFRTAEEKKTAAILQQQGARLIEVAKRIEHDEKPKPDAVRALSRRLDKLGQQMLRGRMTKRVALTEMGELRQELEKAQAQSTQDQSNNQAQLAEALKAAPLESEAGRDVQKDLQNNKWDEAAKRLDELADKIENGQLSQQEREQTARDLERTAKELRARGGDANKNLADQLQSAANALRQSQPRTPPQSPPGQSGQSGQQNQNQNGQQGNKSGQSPRSGQQNDQQPGHQGLNGQSGGHQSPPGLPHPGGMPGAQSQQHQGGQQGQSGQQGQNQQGQSGSQQSQSGSQSGQSGTQPGQSGSQPGQEGSQGQSGAGQGQSQEGQGGGDQSAANALRGMANGLQSGGGSGSDDLKDMLSKIHEAENQTGTNGSNQSGLGDNSEGNDGGQTFGGQQPTMVTPGQDLMPTDPHGAVQGGAGLGPRDHAQGNAAGGGVSHSKSERTGDHRLYQDVWSDRLPKTHAQLDRITGKWGGSGDMETTSTRGEAKGGPVKTPYYEVYESYKQDAEQSVSRESVPPAYKQPVKDYFESIKPD